MKKGKKHKQKNTVPAAKKSREAPQKQLQIFKSKQEAPIDKAARRELRKQEKVQCAIQCKKYIKKLQVPPIIFNDRHIYRCHRSGMTFIPPVRAMLRRNACCSPAGSTMVG